MGKKRVVTSIDNRVECIVEAILEKKGKDALSLNVGDLPNSICKYFIICHGDSTTQVDAIAGNVEDKMLELHHEKVWKSAGYDNSLWIILDYVDIVVHIFQKESRDFYRLEELWADADKKIYNDEKAVEAKPKTRSRKHL